LTAPPLSLTVDASDAIVGWVEVEAAVECLDLSRRRFER
jgi:hypothetical protein